MTHVARQKSDVAVVEGCALGVALRNVEGYTLKEAKGNVKGNVEGYALRLLIKLADGYALGMALGDLKTACWEGLRARLAAMLRAVGYYS